jgi:hypothetical protein
VAAGNARVAPAVAKTAMRFGAAMRFGRAIEAGAARARLAGTVRSKCVGGAGTKAKSARLLPARDVGHRGLAASASSASARAN